MCKNRLILCLDLGATPKVPLYIQMSFPIFHKKKTKKPKAKTLLVKTFPVRDVQGFDIPGLPPRSQLGPQASPYTTFPHTTHTNPVIPSMPTASITLHTLTGPSSTLSFALSANAEVIDCSTSMSQEVPCLQPNMSISSAIFPIASVSGKNTLSRKDSTLLSGPLHTLSATTTFSLPS